MKTLVDKGSAPLLGAAVEKNYRTRKILVKESHPMTCGDYIVVDQSDDCLWETPLPQKPVQSRIRLFRSHETSYVSIENLSTTFLAALPVFAAVARRGHQLSPSSHESC